MGIFLALQHYCVCNYNQSIKHSDTKYTSTFRVHCHYALHSSRVYVYVKYIAKHTSLERTLRKKENHRISTAPSHTCKLKAYIFTMKTQNTRPWLSSLGNWGSGLWSLTASQLSPHTQLQRHMHTLFAMYIHCMYNYVCLCMHQTHHTQIGERYDCVTRSAVEGYMEFCAGCRGRARRLRGAGSQLSASLTEEGAGLSFMSSTQVC